MLVDKLSLAHQKRLAFYQSLQVLYGAKNWMVKKKKTHFTIVENVEATRGYIGGFDSRREGCQSPH